jgi:hypothetical protein
MLDVMRPLLRVAGALPLLALSVATSGRMVAVDRSEASRGAAAAVQTSGGVPVRNGSPRLLFAERSAILILIDGDPIYRPVKGTDLQRISNTKPFIVRDTAGIHYLKVFDGWMEAYSLTGVWSVAGVPPGGAEEALRRAVASRRVDLLDGATAAKPRETPRLDDDTAPTIVISTEPAELIVTNGPPRFATVKGTSLEYVENTTAKVFKEPTDEELYVLVAGRWFRAWTTDGPWELVPERELPADIAAVVRGSVR